MSFYDSILIPSSSTIEGTIEVVDYLPNYLVYNPSSPFMYKGDFVLAARVEPLSNVYDSQIIFFKRNTLNTDNTSFNWSRIINLPTFNLEDPFVTNFDGMLILGGVKIYVTDQNELTDYRTVFYMGKDLDNLYEFYIGPHGMKDIKFIKLQNGKIALFSRPQIVSKEDPYGKGRISFTIINSLDDLAEGIEKAKIIERLYLPNTWGGCNNLYELKNGNIGILGHQADIGPRGERHYRSIALEFNIEACEVISYEVIATRSMFPYVKPKDEFLYDVLFTGGMVKETDSDKYRLYVGVSDSAIGSILINYPFSSELI